MSKKVLKYQCEITGKVFDTLEQCEYYESIQKIIKDYSYYDSEVLLDFLENLTTSEVTLLRKILEYRSK